MEEKRTRKEWLTKKIATEYRKRALQLSNDVEDVGERRKLRIELQERCGLTELEALNILNGNHIEEYVHKYYLLENNIPLQKDKKKNSNLVDVEAIENEELNELRSGKNIEINPD